MKRFVFSAMMGLNMAVATPVLAQPEGLPAPQVSLDRQPWLASSLTLVTPLVLWPLSARLGNPTVAGWVIPAGFGAGHLYAGDPWKGVLVSVGGIAVTHGAAAAVHALQWTWAKAPSNGTADLQVVSTEPYIFWVGLTAIVYGAWAAWDAYETTERTNQRELESPRW